MTNRPYVPYGPYLSSAAVIVLMSWKWVWLFELTRSVSIRRLFGDIPSLAILAAAALVGLALLRGTLRLYRMIPG